ncbi:hypothetical protein CCACVL1_07209 [Corchorus capsularis]|uniref:Uncharacterized protein n=1 Tax=Corchorus capsularis TaxID=210143 RepID=A0A1R3J8N9_COCAP|nr:hypothetical protein CCACVL1_07209 [Corchorus capsularis]
MPPKFPEGSIDAVEGKFIDSLASLSSLPPSLASVTKS